MRVKTHWLYFYLALTIAAFFFFQKYQPALTYEFAESFDGNDYRYAYQFFSGQSDDYSVPPPFHQRILVPFMASWLGNGILQDFQLVNLMFSILSVWIIFLLWRRLGLEFKWIMFGFIWLIFHWSGLIRLNAFDPITVDVPIYFFQGLLLLVVFNRKFKALLWLAPLATAQKESFIGFMVVLLLYAIWHNRKFQDGYFLLKPIIAATLLAISCKLLTSYYFPPTEPGRGALVMIAYQAKQLLQDPFEIIRWLAAISMAFGPILWLSLKNIGKLKPAQAKNNLLFLWAMLSLGYGLLAGGDMTRISFLGFPFVMTWSLLALQEKDFTHFQLLAILSLPLMMLHTQIPDPAFQWDLWQQWYPEFANHRFVLMVIGYTFMVSLILIIFQKRAALNPDKVK